MPASTVRLARTLGRAGQRFCVHHAASACSRLGLLAPERPSKSVCRGLAHRLGSRPGRSAWTRTSEKTSLLPEVSSSRPRMARPALRLRRWLAPERRRALHRLVRSGGVGTRLTRGSSSHASDRPQCGQNRETRASMPQRPDAARPNPSLNRTRYGKAAWPGHRYAVHFRCPRQEALPPRSG